MPTHEDGVENRDKVYIASKTAISPRSSIRLWGRFPQGTSATQRQKFHTDDINQCLHNNSHGDPNANMFNFTFLLVDFDKVLRSSANELQQNSNVSSRETIFFPFSFSHFFISSENKTSSSYWLMNLKRKQNLFFLLAENLLIS